MSELWRQLKSLRNKFLRREHLLFYSPELLASMIYHLENAACIDYPPC